MSPKRTPPKQRSKRSEAARKAGSTTSPKKAAAARANGKKGGSKGGRPPKSYAWILERVGPPPEDPIALPGWGARVLAIAMEATLRGEGTRAANQELRAFVNAMIRGVPMERLMQAERKIGTARAPTRPHERKGPEMVPYDPNEPRGKAVRR